jgi:hypothetical protein
MTPFSSLTIRGLGNELMRSRLEALKDEIHEEFIFLEAYSGVANLRFVVISLLLSPYVSVSVATLR